MSQLRILSLLPAATEIVYLLGLDKYLVGVSDDCDYPLRARKLPKVTECLAENLTSRQIDQKVKELGHMGMSISHLDQAFLKKLKPNLILTQDLCHVCAVSYSQVKKAARVLDGDVRIVSLEPESIEDILTNIQTIGEYTNSLIKSKQIILELRKRISKLTHPSYGGKLQISNSSRPKVLMVEWLDPLMVAGHWVPEMIEKAGGIAVETKVGQKSFPITIDQIVKADPDIVVFAPCGFDIKRTLREKGLIEKFLHIIDDRHKSVEIPKIFLVDGNAYLTRPGPRIIDGVEILAEIFHPEVFPKKHKNSDWQIFQA